MINTIWRALLYGGSWSRPTRLAMVAAAGVVYAGVFVLAHGVLGPSTGALSAIPVAMAGVLLGVRPGFVAALVFLAVNAVLYQVVGVPGAGALPRVATPGSFILVATGIGVGWLRELNHRVRYQASLLERQRARHEAVLRVARRFADEHQPGQIFGLLVREAQDVLGGGAAAVFRFSSADEELVLVETTWPDVPGSPRIPIGHGALGRAAETRAPVILNDYQSGRDALPKVAALGFRAAVAVPLLYEGRLVGALTVGSASPGKRFTQDDAEVLELMAGLAAATLVRLERAKLEGVLLAARTAEHEVNNRLSTTVGYAELLVRDADLPPHLERIASDILRGAESAAEIVQRLRNVHQLHETEWGPWLGTTIDLKRSSS